LNIKVPCPFKSSRTNDTITAVSHPSRPESSNGINMEGADQKKKKKKRRKEAIVWLFKFGTGLFLCV
jgi:hypothetical protein